MRVRTIEEHAEAIAELVERALDGRGTETMRTSAARTGVGSDRRVLAADVIAPIDLPPFDNSQMDGYAVASVDLRGGPVTLDVAARIPAGHSPSPLARGTAAPIMTGAPIPVGADAVVQIERAEPAHFLPEDGNQTVTVPGAIPAGLFVRATGSDLPAGSLLFPAGTALGAAQWGSLVAAGVESVSVVVPPRVLVVSTGEELADSGEALAIGAIYDANGTSMAVALRAAGADVVVERVRDDVDALLGVVRRHADVDLIVTTGGVSEGAYEVVREAFGRRGVTFGAVTMQPGGPQGWGVVSVDGRGVPVVSFPGNPVSALISFEAFLRAPLLRATGRRVPDRTMTARLAEGADSPPGKHQIRRARLDDDGLVHFVGGPSSHLLHHYAQATVLAHIPLGVSRVEVGDEVVVWPLDD